MNKVDMKKIKSILMLVLAFFEIILGTIFLVFYLIEDKSSSLRDAFCILSIIMYVLGFVTIAYNDYGDKVVIIAKKIGRVVFNLTLGLVFRAFDALFNMVAPERTTDLKAIKGYRDNEISIKAKIKKKKANYKSYRKMDNREKVQFLYYKTVTKAIRKGFYFKDSDTPREVNGKMINSKYINVDNRQLGEIYNVSKYNDNAEITDVMVDVVKNIG